jgi:hypothetical protein
MEKGDSLLRYVPLHINRTIDIPVSSRWLISVGRHRGLHKVPIRPNNELVHSSFLRIAFFYNICEVKIFSVLALAKPPYAGVLLLHALRLSEEDKYFNRSNPSLAKSRHVGCFVTPYLVLKEQDEVAYDVEEPEYPVDVSSWTTECFSPR